MHKYKVDRCDWDELEDLLNERKAEGWLVDDKFFYQTAGGVYAPTVRVVVVFWRGDYLGDEAS